MSNKKGEATDPLVIMVILFFLAVTFIITIFMNNILTTVISTTALNTTSAAPSILSAFQNINTNVVQRGFILMFGIMVIFMIASSFMVRIHPVFIFLYIITLMVTLFSGVYIANIYHDLQSNSVLASVFASQPMINYVMNHLVGIIMALGGLSMLVVFSKLFQPPVGTGF